VIRSVAGVIAGFIVSVAVMMGMEFANASVFYPGFAELVASKDREAIEQARKSAPDGKLDTQAELRLRRETVKEALASAPAGALWVVIAGSILGSLAGGYVATWLSKKPLLPGAVLGVLLTLASIANNLMLPPPAWFWLASIVVFIPAACAGARMAPRPGAARGNES
jgi:hypothetical protein